MKKCIVLVCFMFAPMIFAQNFKFGKVSQQELQEKSHPEYPEASASILYKKQRIYFDYQQGKGFVQNNDIHERIKIYTKDGFDYATRMISLYQGDNSTSREEVIGLKAYTYTLEGGKMVKTKLKSDGIFEESTGKYRKRTKFTMPNIKEGCVIEFVYTVQSQFFGIDDIPFQQLIPIKRMELKVETPEYLKYSRVLNPKASYVPTIEDSKERGQITLTSKSRQAAGSGASGRAVQTTVNRTQNIDFEESVIRAELDNIPPLKDEVYVDNLSNYQAKLIMELEELAWPGEPIQYLSTSWEKVTKTIYDNPDFGDQISKKSYYKNDVDALVSGIAPEDILQRTAVIFNHVKSKVKWNDIYGYTAEQGVSRAYKDGTGNIADINLMLTSMLRYAGVPTQPVLISTNANGIPITPTLS